MKELTSMKMTEQESRQCSPSVSSEYREEYPYGLCIRLENRQLEKLGIKSMPKPGERITIEAVAFVRDVHVSGGAKKEGDEDPNEDRAISLQITDMAIIRKHGKL